MRGGNGSELGDLPPQLTRVEHSRSETRIKSRNYMIGGQNLSFMGRIITLLTPSPIIFRSFIIYCIEAIMGALGLYGIRKMASQRLNQSERSISMDLDQ